MSTFDNDNARAQRAFDAAASAGMRLRSDAELRAQANRERDSIEGHVRAALIEMRRGAPALFAEHPFDAADLSARVADFIISRR